jgi:DNA-binding PadR family transcriptional regulator
MPMVAISDIPKKVKNALESGVRKKILFILYDGTEKSAYAITKNGGLNISIATVIEHLQKLERVGLIEVKDAPRGKLVRYHYKITEKGKYFLKEYYKYLIDEAKEAPEIIETISHLLGKP